MINDLCKISFRLVQDEDDYPPSTVELVWAKSLSDQDLYEIDNIPFFTCEATLGDVVAVSKVSEELWFLKMVSPSLNSLIRIVFFDKSIKDLVNNDLVALGCLTEYFEQFKLLAISVPPTVKLSLIQQYLQDQATKGGLDYEEAILRQN